MIEVYRIAMGEYQPLKKMLTDNGRQYTTWRGTEAVRCADETGGGPALNEVSPSTITSQRDHAGAEGGDHGDGGSAVVGSVAQDLLPVGEARPDGTALGRE